MQVNIESPHLQISDVLYDKVHTEFLNLQKVFAHITSCQVVLKVEKSGQRKNCEIEAQVLIPHHSIFARKQAETFELALHTIKTTIQRQLKCEKERWQETW